MSRSFYFIVTLFFLCLHIESQGQVSIKAVADNNLESEESLIILPNESGEPINPIDFLEYSSSLGVSLKAGVKIRPQQNGWFSANIKSVAGSNQVIPSDAIPSKMVLYPNPVIDGKLKISQLPETVDNAWNIRISDLSGRAIYRADHLAQSHKLVIAMDEIPDGKYVVQLNGGEYSLNRRIIVYRR